jgi:hypothetical protein
VQKYTVYSVKQGFFQSFLKVFFNELVFRYLHTVFFGFCDFMAGHFEDLDSFGVFGNWACLNGTQIKTSPRPSPKERETRYEAYLWRFVVDYYPKTGDIPFQNLSIYKEKYFYRNQRPSPDSSGNPFVPVFGTKRL